MTKKFIHSDEDWEEIQREVYEEEQIKIEAAKDYFSGRDQRTNIPSSEW